MGSAARHGDRPALREGERVVSHAELLSAVDTAASALSRLGVRERDRVLVAAPNATSPIVLLFALSRLGACSVVVSPKLADQALDGIARQCDPRIALYVPDRGETMASHAARRGARLADIPPLGALAVERFAGDVAADTARDVAVMLCTSGTTDVPKAAMLTHANLLFLARAQAVARRYGPGDRVYLALPLAFAGAIASITATTLSAGGCLHLYPQFDPATLARALRDEAITVLPGVPASHALTVAWARRFPGRFAAPSLRLATSAASPLDAAVKADAEALYGLPLQNGYGLTETTAVVCQTPLDEPRADTSVGRPLPGIRIRVAGDDGREVARGAIGEILVRGPNVFAGYFRRDDATREAFTDDGWFRTGDLGRLDEGGALHIAARTKELIKRLGFSVFPADVEAALAAHPDVASCGVVGRPQGADEAIVAFVQRRPGATVDDEALAAFVRTRLALHQRPGEYRFVGAMPTTASGKVDRAALRKLA